MKRSEVDRKQLSPMMQQYMDIKDKYINFFVSKGHKQIPSASVVPENDPTCLFNTAGMQPLVPYHVRYQ